ncbi:MAG: TraR/DksA family transcriptional regulator [Elusimicrobiota bacterium]|nr:TraR/DksA family transcriptional regulator [Elusimicrobiota bacterium]
MKKPVKTAKKTAVKKAPAKKAAAKKTARPAAAKSTIQKKLAPPKRPAAVGPAKAAPVKKSRPAEALTKAELAAIAAVLSEMKTDIAKNVEDKKNLDMLEPEVGDSIDQATQSLDKEILFELSDNERKILRDIESALRKMEKGTYGLCEHCKDIIDRKRIKALPSARYCIDCQNGSEKKKV